jgi:hypothetical protein
MKPFVGDTGINFNGELQAMLAQSRVVAMPKALVLDHLSRTLFEQWLGCPELARPDELA